MGNKCRTLSRQQVRVCVHPAIKETINGAYTTEIAKSVRSGQAPCRGLKCAVSEGPHPCGWRNFARSAESSSSRILDLGQPAKRRNIKPAARLNDVYRKIRSHSKSREPITDQDSLTVTTFRQFSKGAFFTRISQSKNIQYFWLKERWPASSNSPSEGRCRSK